MSISFTTRVIPDVLGAEEGLRTRPTFPRLSFSLHQSKCISAPFASLSLSGGGLGPASRPPPQLIASIARAAAVDSERFRRVRIIGDGRCLFRATAQGTLYPQIFLPTLYAFTDGIV